MDRKKTMITTLVFDLDDTLYDEVEYCRSGFSAVADFLASSPGRPCKDEIFDSLWEQFSSGNHTATFNAALNNLDLSYDSTAIKELIGVYRNHVPQIVLPDDSKEVLDSVSGKYKLAMLTDGFMPAQKLKVHALGIESYFQCIVYTEELGREFWKPSPVGFEKIAKELNEKPENMAYIADNEKKDFIAPNLLGFTTIKLTRPAGIHRTPAETAEAKPKYIIEKLGDLPEFISKL